MLRIITELPLQYKKFFPFGSPPRTIGCPRCVRGKVAYVNSLKMETEKKSYLIQRVTTKLSLFRPIKRILFQALYPLKKNLNIFVFFFVASLKLVFFLNFSRALWFKINFMMFLVVP